MLKYKLTCIADFGEVIFKVYSIEVGPALLLLIISSMETPFGPKGRVALTCKDEAVVNVVKMGGPKVASETQKNKM